MAVAAMTFFCHFVKTTTEAVCRGMQKTEGELNSIQSVERKVSATYIGSVKEPSTNATVSIFIRSIQKETTKRRKIETKPRLLKKIVPKHALVLRGRQVNTCIKVVEITMNSFSMAGKQNMLILKRRKKTTTTVLYLLACIDEKKHR